MNQLFFFIRSELLFSLLEEWYEHGRIKLAFRIDPMYSKGLRLVLPETGRGLIEQYISKHAEEVLVTKTIEYSDDSGVRDFYNRSSFELISVKGCRNSTVSAELGTMRLVHAKSMSKDIFDDIYSLIKKVAKKKLVEGNPNIYFDQALSGQELCDYGEKGKKRFYKEVTK